jgi:hypothetical protein
MADLRQALEELLQVLVQHRVVGHVVRELRQLRRARQLLVQQQPHHLDEMALLRELFDRVAGVAQDALLAVQEGDLRQAGAGVAEARVVGDGAGLGAQLANVDGDFTFAADHHRQIDLLVTESEFGGLGNGHVGHRGSCDSGRRGGGIRSGETRRGHRGRLLKNGRP